MKYLRGILMLTTLLFIFGCGGGKDDDGGTTDPVIEEPEAATLVFPLKDSECNLGTIVSNEESMVEFEWNASANTDSYSIVIKNLIMDTEEIFNTNSTSMDITLKRGVPYSWKVISKASRTNKTAGSEIWNFYNAGVGVINHVPFPAELINPEMNSILTGQNVSLSWEGVDIDYDIDEYMVYVDETLPPTTLVATTSMRNVEIEVQPGKNYFWKVVTIDAQTNSSESDVFEFSTE